MTSSRPRAGGGLAPWVRVAVFAIGAGDAATGLALVAAPEWTGSHLGLPPVADEARIFLRWIGVFVLAIGLAYFHPWRTATERARRERLRSVLEWTAGARLLVAGFIASSVATGALAEGWCFVGAYDALVASGQLLLLARGAIPDADA